MQSIQLRGQIPAMVDSTPCSIHKQHRYNKKTNTLKANCTILKLIVATNKNQYVLNAVGGELTRVGRLHTCEFSFLMVGHTKNSVDAMFANWSKSWKTQDIFNHL